jgi:hypothetical protein
MAPHRRAAYRLWFVHAVPTMGKDPRDSIWHLTVLQIGTGFVNHFHEFLAVRSLFGIGTSNSGFPL